MKAPLGAPLPSFFSGAAELNKPRALARREKDGCCPMTKEFSQIDADDDEEDAEKKRKQEEFMRQEEIYRHRQREARR